MMGPKTVEIQLDPEAARILRTLLSQVEEARPCKGLELPGDNWKTKAPVHSYNGGICLRGKNTDLILSDSGNVRLTIVEEL